jgi:hypothetical protein
MEKDALHLLPGLRALKVNNPFRLGTKAFVRNGENQGTCKDVQ